MRCQTAHGGPRRIVRRGAIHDQRNQPRSVLHPTAFVDVWMGGGGAQRASRHVLCGIHRPSLAPRVRPEYVDHVECQSRTTVQGGCESVADVDVAAVGQHALSGKASTATASAADGARPAGGALSAECLHAADRRLPAARMGGRTHAERTGGASAFTPDSAVISAAEWNEPA